MKTDINQALEQLASAFNTTVDKLYPILIKQAFISGIMDLLLAAAITVVLFHGIRYAVKKINSGLYVDELLLVAGGFAGIVLLIIALFSVYEGFTAILNPEYWALREILDTFKKQ